ncbi:MAG: serine/threonine protein kinase [Candidatus Sericytochromatia bacterium]
MLQQGMTFAQRYVLLDQKGQGGMATIFRALDLETNQMVAVKHLNLPPHLSNEEKQTRIERFEAEVQILGLLSHANIMAIYEYIVQSDNHVMVLELLDGQELKPFVQSHNLTMRQKLMLFDQLLDALEYVHSHGIIHCDLKPENVMVINGDTIKLLDFGIARIEGSETPASRDALVGTVAYMSPEQLQNSKISHNQIDIYALGVVMYEILTGRLPFEADNPGSAMLMILNNAPVPPEQLNPLVGEDLGTLIMTCLQKRTQHRFRQCRQLRQLMRVVMERSFAESTPNGPPERSYLPKIKAFDHFGLLPEMEKLIRSGASGQCILWNTFLEASLWLDQGALIHIDIKNKTYPPLEAFKALMTWESGSLMYFARSAPSAKPLEMPQGEALLTLCRTHLMHYFEFWEFYQTADIPEVIMMPSASTRLPEASLALLDLIDGKLCVGELYAALPHNPMQFMEGLKSLEDRQSIFVERYR